MTTDPELPDGLAEVAERLYAGSPGDFTPARTAAEKAAKADGDKVLMAAVKALRRPSVGAWAVNVLVRRESDQIDQVLEVAASLRAAAEALDGQELRALTKQRRQLTSVLTTRARQLALEAGTRLTQATADQVEGTLTAAMLDAAAADAVRTGLLVTTISATGVDEGGYADAVAVPGLLGTRAAAAVDTGPGLHVVPENRAVRREAARDRLNEALQELADAERGRRAAAKAKARLEADRLRLHSEVDELQRRIGEAEERIEQLDEDIEVAEQDDEDAASAVDEATRARDAAQDALDAL